MSIPVADARRRRRFIAYVKQRFGQDALEPHTDARRELTQKLGRSKGRLPQLVNPELPFGSRAAANAARAFRLREDYFDSDEPASGATHEAREPAPQVPKPVGIAEALAVIKPYLENAEPGARKAAGTLLASWAEDPGVNHGTAVTLERMLEPGDGIIRRRGSHRSK
jgi:hypothetical protein